MELTTFKVHLQRGTKINGFVYAVDETPSELTKSYAVSPYEDKVLFQSEFSNVLSTCSANEGDFIIVDQSPITTSGYTLRAIPEWQKLIKKEGDFYVWKHNTFNVTPLHELMLPDTPFVNHITHKGGRNFDITTYYGLLSIDSHKVLCIYNDLLIDVVAIRKPVLNKFFLDTVYSDKTVNYDSCTLAEYLYYAKKR